MNQRDVTTTIRRTFPQITYSIGKILLVRVPDFRFPPSALGQSKSSCLTLVMNPVEQEKCETIGQDETLSSRG
jgi:hypothetical protein